MAGTSGERGGALPKGRTCADSTHPLFLLCPSLRASPASVPLPPPGVLSRPPRPGVRGGRSRAPLQGKSTLLFPHPPPPASRARAPSTKDVALRDAARRDAGLPRPLHLPRRLAAGDCGQPGGPLVPARLLLPPLYGEGEDQGRRLPAAERERVGAPGASVFPSVSISPRGACPCAGRAPASCMQARTAGAGRRAGRGAA